LQLYFETRNPQKKVQVFKVFVLLARSFHDYSSRSRVEHGAEAAKFLPSAAVPKLQLG